MIRSHAKVPLPKDGGLVSTLAQQARERGHAVVQVRGKCGHLVDVIVGASQDRGPAWRANPVRAEAIIQPHAFIRNPVQVGRRIDPATVATHGMGSMIVGHDEHDIWAGRGAIRHNGTRQDVGNKTRLPYDVLGSLPNALATKANPALVLAPS